MTILPKVIYISNIMIRFQIYIRFPQHSLRTQSKYFYNSDGTIKISQLAKEILRNIYGGFSFPDFNVYYKAIINKIGTETGTQRGYIHEVKQGKFSQQIGLDKLFSYMQKSKVRPRPQQTQWLIQNVLKMLKLKLSL